MLSDKATWKRGLATRRQSRRPTQWWRQWSLHKKQPRMPMTIKLEKRETQLIRILFKCRFRRPINFQRSEIVCASNGATHSSGKCHFDRLCVILFWIHSAVANSIISSRFMLQSVIRLVGRCTNNTAALAIDFEKKKNLAFSLLHSNRFMNLARLTRLPRLWANEWNVLSRFPVRKYAFTTQTEERFSGALRTWHFSKQEIPFSRQHKICIFKQSWAHRHICRSFLRLHFCAIFSLVSDSNAFWPECVVDCYRFDLFMRKILQTKYK